MKLNALRDFLAVAERGGVRAARHLGLAQPAISRSIAELERNWARRCSSATPRACSSRRSDRPSCAAPPPSTMRSSAPATRRANCAAPSTAASRWACPPPRTWSCSPTCCRRSARAFPTSTWKSSTASIRWSRRAAGRFHGFLRRPGARARAGRAAGRAVRQYPRHPGPQGHPLAQAKSLRELANAHWITTSITHKAEEELGPLFEKHGLPAPKLAMRAQSALTFLTALPSSDLLMMLPVQWLRYPLLRDTFQEIKVREKLPAPPVCIVQRTGLPLTPAAEHYCTLLRRRRAHQEAVAPTGARATVDRGPGRARSARRQRSGGSTAWPS